MIEIRTAEAFVQIREDMGAAVSRYTLSNGQDIFRPAPDESEVAFEMGCILLAPWCNRVSDGGFYCDEVFYPLKPNWPDDASPLHGSAFQQPWRVHEQTEYSVRLVLDCDLPAPFRYRAEVHYALDGASLGVALSVTNLSEMRLPYGIGVHPWFPKQASTLLTTANKQVILTDTRQLPTQYERLTELADWDFSQGKVLPAKGLDHCFEGWNREAEIHWPEHDVSLAITADESLSFCHIYSPGQDADFFCLEPVSHPLNAHNWPDRSLSALSILETGESLTGSCVFTPN